MRVRNAGIDPEKMVKRREEGRAFHRKGPTLAKDLVWAAVRPQPSPDAPSAPSAELSRVPPPQQRTSVALGSMWPKSLTLSTSRGHMDLARKMIIGNQLQLLLRLLVVSCLIHLLPLIYYYHLVLSFLFMYSSSLLFCSYFRNYTENFSLL